jgi:two-component system response regulator YesN
MEKSIINAVKSGDYQLTLKEFDIIAKHLNTSSLEYIKRVCYEIYVSLNRSLYESGINTEEILRDKYDIFSKLSNCTNTKEVFILISNVFKLLAENVSNQKQSHRTKIVGEVIKYIEENFSNNISLKEASEKVYLNINYLSEIFKAEKGENFTEYLKKLRVRKAVDLLSRLDLKIYQISEMVGYSDPKHFSQVFKEITGVSPKDYKVNTK